MLGHGHFCSIEICLGIGTLVRVTGVGIGPPLFTEEDAASCSRQRVPQRGATHSGTDDDDIPGLPCQLARLRHVICPSIRINALANNSQVAYRPIACARLPAWTEKFTSERIRVTEFLTTSRVS